MSPPQYFDYKSLAIEAGISARDIARLEAVIRSVHPDDEMLYQLRLLRTVQAIADRRATVDDALRDFGSDQASSAA